MFSPKTKSTRIRADSANGVESKATSKGLLSFNTSNFTKIFKNPTNFVQSTFSNVTSINSTASSTADQQEPSINPFTVPRTNISTANSNANTITTTAAANASTPLKSLIPNGKPRNEKDIAVCSSSPPTDSSQFIASNSSAKVTSNGAARNEANKIVDRDQQMAPNASPCIERRSSTGSRTPAIEPVKATADTTASSIIFETVKLNRTPSQSKLIPPTVAPNTLDAEKANNVVKSPIRSQMDTDGHHSLGNRNGTNSKTISTACSNGISQKSDALSNRNKSQLSTGGGGGGASNGSNGSIGVGFEYANKANDKIEPVRNANVIIANNVNKSDTGFVSECFNANNNIDYNLQQCIEQIEASSVFETNANKLDRFCTVNYHPIATVGDYFAAHETNQINAYHQQQQQQQQQGLYQQQSPQQYPEQNPSLLSFNLFQQRRADARSYPDGNENELVSIPATTTSPNNNSVTDGKKCTSGGNGLSNNTINNSSPSHGSNGGNNNTIVTNKYNQNFIVAKSAELHDIQEELYNFDDEQHFAYDPFAVRQVESKGWNSLPVNKYANYYGTTMAATATSVPIPPTNNNNMSAASFGAASSALSLSAFNRNPFLQLSTNVTTSPISPTSTSPFFCSANQFESSTMAHTSSTANNNNGTCSEYATTNIFATLRCDNATHQQQQQQQQQQYHSQQQQITVDEESNELLSDAGNLHSEPMTLEAMHTLQLFLQEHGTEYIKQFLEVINILFS